MPAAISRPYDPTGLFQKSPGWLQGLLDNASVSPVMTGVGVGAGLGQEVAKEGAGLVRSAAPAMEGAGKAASDMGSMALEGLKKAAQRMLQSTSPTRLEELYQKFGGLGH